MSETNSIKATDAQTIADQFKGLRCREMAQEHLKKIYESIRKNSYLGSYDTTVSLERFDDEFKSHIQSSLENDGYEVKFSRSRDFEGESYYYVNISWSKS